METDLHVKLVIMGFLLLKNLAAVSFQMCNTIMPLLFMTIKLKRLKNRVDIKITKNSIITNNKRLIEKQLYGTFLASVLNS